MKTKHAVLKQDGKEDYIVLQSVLVGEVKCEKQLNKDLHAIKGVNKKKKIRVTEVGTRLYPATNNKIVTKAIKDKILTSS